MAVSGLWYRDDAGLWHEATAGSDGAAAARSAAVLEHTMQRGTALPPGTEHRWRGEFSIATDGDYDLNLQLLGAIGSLGIDGRRVAATNELGLHGGVLQPSEDNVLPTVDGVDNVRRRVHLSAGARSFALELNGDCSRQPAPVLLTRVTPRPRR